MARHLIQASLEVWVDDGVYWPEPVRVAVANNESDPYKDIASHLASFIHQAIDSVHGAEFDSVVIKNITTREEESC